jgi:hypothetical protein
MASEIRQRGNRVPLGHFRSPPNNIGFAPWRTRARHSGLGTAEPKHRDLPEIRPHPGQRKKVVDALEDALIGADWGAHCHGNRLVEIAWQEMVADGKDRSLQLVPITELGWSSDRRRRVQEVQQTDKKWVTRRAKGRRADLS